jgi:hypothetical protein
MKRQIKLRERAWSALAALLALAAVVSCGGGVVGSGGTGSPVGLAVGTVNGFGSVIVDGVAYDDRSASVVEEIAPGRYVPSDVKLGDRVSVQYETAGVASVVHVEAALSGPAASSVSMGQFSMLGQTVTVNADGNAGPITQFGGGYSQASDLRAGDSIEVHGLLVRQADSSLIQATRIDKLAAAPAYLRVTGIVSKLSNSGAVTLVLGGLTVDATGATVLPATTALANGQTVTVLALPVTLQQPSADTWRLQAAQIRIRELRGEGLDDSVSGSVSNLDALVKTLTLGSLRVNYSAAAVSPATATLANGQYVRVRGRVGADGVLAASSLTIHNAGADDEAELRGNISGYDPATGRFSVRDVMVDASGAIPQGCPATGLANGLYVEVEGSLSSSGVVASKVQCENEPSGASVEREGVAADVDIAGMSFSLVPEKGAAVSVRWTSTTYFGGVKPDTLAGKSVKVEGSLVDGVLIASKIKVGD